MPGVVMLACRCVNIERLRTLRRTGNNVIRASASEVDEVASSGRILVQIKYQLI